MVKNVAPQLHQSVGQGHEEWQVEETTLQRCT